MHSSTVRSPWTLLSRVRTFTVLLVFSFSPTTFPEQRKQAKRTKKKNQYLDGRGGRDTKDTERKRQTRSEKSVSTLTQDEVVLCQLCVSDLFVQSAAWVEIHVGHETAHVEFLLDLQH